jgi:chromate transporter
MRDGWIVIFAANGCATLSGMPAVVEVFVVFLKLGLTSFGGPIAHLGYFHRELVERRRWIDDAQYAQLVAICQALPGPASSQTGFALGLMRAGWPGACAAFLGFTLPSAVLLVALQQFLPLLEQPLAQAALHGLTLVAVAIVAQAVWGMAKLLTPDVPRVLIAAAGCAAVIVNGTAWMQLAVIAAGAALGMVLCRHVLQLQTSSPAVRYGLRTGTLLIVIFVVLLIAALVFPQSAPAAFYRAGALVFGGGHVVLPLLQQAVVTPGWVSQDEFLIAYGAAQAVPGPLFSIAAFLGARIDGIGGATLGLLAIFLPGLLLVAGVLPMWRSITARPASFAALAGINASAVGLLAAALYTPLWTSAISTVTDVAIALIAFVVLIATRTPVLLVIASCVLASIARAWLGG